MIKLQACKFIEKRFQHWCFPWHVRKFLETPILETANGCFCLFFQFSNLFAFGCLFTIVKKSYDLSVKKMFNEVTLCNRMTYVFKGHVKIAKTCMVKFNASILNRLKIMFFLVNTKYKHKYNVILHKTVTKLVTILTKYFFPYLNPTSYLKEQLPEISEF